MNVLNLVTTKSSFFKVQVNTLESKGICVDSISVPGAARERTKSDYIRFYTRVLKEMSGDYDIIHANYGLTAPMALLQPKRPIVLSLWGDDLIGKYGTLVKKCAKYFDEVILPSPTMADDLSMDYTLVPFGVDSDLFRPIPRQKARDQIGWGQEDLVVLFPYDPSRSVKRFELAKQIVDATSVDVKLHVLFGEPYEKVPLYMNASDAVLITSEHESGPMVAKEAALCNVPVVSSDVGFVSDVLSDVKNSYVCSSEQELVDRLGYVLDSGDRSDGRKYAEEWSTERMGDRLINIYDSVLD